MNRLAKFACGLVLLTGVAACGGGDSEGGEVLDTTITLSEGVYHSYTLEPGTYHVSITSSNNGVTVQWLGGSGTGCSGSGEVKVWSATCALSIKGQLIVTNPTVFGLGGSEIVTIRLTKD
ncbi:hypothetical protein CATMQ487_01810 [Sphaerotilus microaerophilus]|uniref:Lipoprotein n=1 Tax=Sphaerotilus microaerophilus TaxID=2914710 RepID=A0ABM7YGB5_9BURK|nr:hypothetical protein CATMQ487_01810 [Sphaerotilus sp. FB-5]